MYVSLWFEAPEMKTKASIFMICIRDLFLVSVSFLNELEIALILVFNSVFLFFNGEKAKALVNETQKMNVFICFKNQSKWD